MLSINVKKIVELIQACHLVATRDVAKLYNVETKVLNQVIKRNTSEGLSGALNGYFKINKYLKGCILKNT